LCYVYVNNVFDTGKMYTRKRLFLTDGRLTARSGGVVKKKCNDCYFQFFRFYLFFFYRVFPSIPHPLSPGDTFTIVPHLRHPHLVLGYIRRAEPKIANERQPFTPLGQKLYFIPESTISAKRFVLITSGPLREIITILD